MPLNAAIRRDSRVADDSEALSTAYLRESISELIEATRILARRLESEARRVDEYDSATLTPESITSLTLQPQFDRFAELIEKIIITGPASGQTSFQVGNTSTNPGANSTIASLGVLPAGLYSVQPTVELQGTVTAADANNMRLRSQAQSVQAEFVYPGVAGTYPQGTVVVQSDGVNAILIQAIAAASGAAAIYGGELIATPIPPTFTLLLGDRQWNLTLPSTGILAIPCKLLLDRNSNRILQSTFPGNWGLELMGTADVRNRP